jgi:hypothetical protein
MPIVRVLRRRRNEVAPADLLDDAAVDDPTPEDAPRDRADGELFESTLDEMFARQETRRQTRSGGLPEQRTH